MPTTTPAGQESVTPAETPAETWATPPLPTETPATSAATPAGTRTPTPAPTPSFEDALACGTPYAYADNRDFHALSVYVGECQMKTGFYYTPGGGGNPVARWEAAPGSKFLLVGVDFYMTGIRKEGKSSRFMTPLATSFELVKGTSSFGVLNATGIPDMTDYYIRDVGSMYRDRLITKDDEGSGVLIYEVPGSFNPNGSYITFCPRNLDSWTGYYRSPDDWDCEKNLVIWQLR